MIARSTFITAQTVVTVIDIHRCKQSTFISCHRNWFWHPPHP